MSKVLKKSTKGYLRSYTSGGVDNEGHFLHFDFNPTTIQESRSVQYDFSEGQGQLKPLAQFGRMGNTEIGFELFFFDHKGVTEQLHSLRKFTLPRNLTRLDYDNQGQPHRYILHLGDYGIFEGVITKVDIKTLQYNRVRLLPIHVTAKIDFVVSSSGTDRDLITAKLNTGGFA